MSCVQKRLTNLKVSLKYFNGSICHVKMVKPNMMYSHGPQNPALHPCLDYQARVRTNVAVSFFAPKLSSEITETTETPVILVAEFMLSF